MKKRTWNICMVGASGVGKTSLVRRFVENIFNQDFKPTFGVAITKKIITTEHLQATLMLWDLAGDDEFLLSKNLPEEAIHLQDQRTARADAYILVADVGRRATLDDVIARQDRIARDKASKNLPKVPFVLALNKCDLMHREFDMADVGRSVNGWRVIQTSAKTGDGVSHVFETIVSTLFETIASSK